MLRERIISEINRTIDSHTRFESSDFILETRKQNYSTALVIRYQIENKYFISFDIPNSESVDGYKFTGTVCPGPLALEEKFSFVGKELMLKWITRWLDTIWEELVSNPFVKKVESQQAQIDEIVAKFDSMDDSYFTIEESIDLISRLDKLESDLKNEIQARKEEKKIQETEINKLHIDIETLKQTIASLKKSGWLKSFASKVVKWTAKPENRKMVGDGYKIIKELLPENIKKGLPEAHQ